MIVSNGWVAFLASRDDCIVADQVWHQTLLWQPVTISSKPMQIQQQRWQRKANLFCAWLWTWFYGDAHLKSPLGSAMQHQVAWSQYRNCTNNYHWVYLQMGTPTKNCHFNGNRIFKQTPVMVTSLWIQSIQVNSEQFAKRSPIRRRPLEDCDRLLPSPAIFTGADCSVETHQIGQRHRLRWLEQFWKFLWMNSNSSPTWSEAILG